MKYMVILSILLMMGACAGAHAQTRVRVLEFNQDVPQGCVHLYVTSGTGGTEKEARAQVMANVVSAGGNAVVFHGGQIEFYPGTRTLKSYTHNAIILKCSDE